MKPLKKTLLATAAAAAVGLGMLGTAQASSYASAILQINNFHLRHSPGGANFVASDFSTLRGTNDAQATAQRNGFSSSDFNSIDIALPPISLNHQCVGACATFEDNYLPIAIPATSLGYADEELRGSSITAGGAMAHTRADASATSSPTNSSGNSSVGTSTTFAFSVAAPGSMTVEFDAIPYLRAFVSGGAAPNTNANARLSWHINIINLATGLAVLDEAPALINQARSLTDGAPGSITYNAGLTSTPFSFTTNAALAAGVNYQLTIEHNTLANALQDERLPEPGTLAALAAGLLSMSLVSRRRKG